MNHFSKQSRQRGVTLIELMVVVLIIGILAAIAYPSYRGQVARTHRNAAAACLSQIAQALERRYTSTLTYINPDAGGNTEDSIGCTSNDDMARFYTFQFPAGSPTQSAYRIEAVPTAVQSAGERNQCGTLALRQDGGRFSTNNDTCWR